MAILVKTKNLKFIASFSTADYKEQRQMMAETIVKFIFTPKNPKFIVTLTEHYFKAKYENYCLPIK